ncbi:flagellar biosynthetic protein FliO [Bartonella refiksaydamii]|uniref:flagellar biosynthetic protein FliO n=1 Tax=Bartonella refiksaydamii TaxID=2654951 RepID=UPI0012EC3DC2|nr:flagellar biosynthetic protein FliO [Bartonella refiksaydamii]
MYVWLSSQIGTSAANITTSAVFFIITIAALSAIILFVRRLNTGKFSINRKKRPTRLTLCDTIAIDRARSLILVRCDDKEHLLLIGGLTDVVVESNITSTSIIQKREAQPTLTTAEITPNANLTEKRSFSTKERERPQNDSSSSFMKQNVEDSAIITEIEGRQEPSLFIPAPKK